MPQGHGNKLPNADNLNVLPVGSSGKVKKTTTKKATSSTGKKVKAFDHHDKAIDIDDYTPHGADNNSSTRFIGRDADSAYDSSSSMRSEPIWYGLPVNAAQIPLMQMGIHLMKQGWNGVMNLLQGRDDAEQITATQELISTEQVVEVLSDYNNISQKLESIIEQLELDSATDKALVDWYKESLAEHQEQGMQLLNKPVINQELLIEFCENMKVFADDLSEFAEQQVNDNVALTYIKAELAKVNEALTNLAQAQFGTLEDIEMLNDPASQALADNLQPILYAD
ncbi:MAG TPA: hypothetical protein LFW20_02330, partial [Rickettsia endosymbiont of Omalisus fontisbellaquei]|nr:hypothetical protein [Rickettsia endosymbiont of Omalisus fontisbellaquei]